MNKRLRAAVLSTIALVAAGLLNVTTASPANAVGDGDTCMDPTVSGSIERVVGESSTIFKPVYAEFNQVGFTSANCPTTFTDFRYKVTFSYDGRTVSSYQTAIQPSYTFTPLGPVRNGTRIVFPTLRLSFAGYKPVTLTVTAGSKSAFSSVWCRSNEDTYDSQISVGEWSSYDTRTGVPRSRINACP